MKSLIKYLLIVTPAVFIFTDINCMKVLNKMGEDNPCWCAYTLKKQAAKEPDQFQKQLLLQKAEVNDQLCQEQNKSVYQSPNLRR
jgi:hypothetical protein